MKLIGPLFNLEVLQSCAVVMEGYCGSVHKFESVELYHDFIDPFERIYLGCIAQRVNVFCQRNCILVAIIQVLVRVKESRNLGC